MRILKFNVDNQKLEKVGDFSGIIRGSKKYLKCLFCFDGDTWHELRKIAVFENTNGEYAVRLLSDGTCLIPDEVTDGSFFRIKVVGIARNTKVFTNKELVCQE